MIPSDLQQIADRHLDRWLNSDAPDALPLREQVYAAIEEALTLRERQWEAGNATLRFERDRALARLP